MTDLDNELRDCLRRHADEASPAPSLVQDVRARSRHLARRRQAFTAGAVVPAVAAVAAVSYDAARSATPHTTNLSQVTPTASSTPAPTVEGNSVSKVLLDCPGYQVPNIVLTTSKHGSTTNIETFIRRARTRHHVLVMRSVPSFALYGHVPPRGSHAIEVATKQGDRHWVLISKKGSMTSATAKGCTLKVHTH